MQIALTLAVQRASRKLIFVFRCLLSAIFALIMSTSSYGEDGAERVLSFYSTHTHERLTVVYKQGDRYDPEALKQIDQILP